VVNRRDVALPSGERLLAATVTNPDVATGAAVLFVHGLGSDRGTNAERAQAVSARLSMTCLAVDLGGHGGSSGRLSELTPRQNLTDVVAAFDALAGEPGVDPARVAVCAASYGAYLSVLATQQRRPERLLLRAPALYTDASLDRPLARRRPGGADAAALRVLAAYPGPVLVVESEHDEVVPATTVQAWCRARPGIDHVVLAGAGHALTDPAWRAAYTEVVLSFLR
jgi:pimeloyl-ACP methyl ester carboxylesterase